jgi:hypothetical protein
MRAVSWAMFVVAGACAAEPEDPAHYPVVGGCEGAGAATRDPFVDCVDELRPQGASFGHDRAPAVVMGPPRGGGGLGGVDVLSLGCGGEITLFFDEPAIVDGPGADFVVFENPFALGDGTFVEPARVLASEDGVEWREFPCALAQRPPIGCAGIGLVSAESFDQDDPEASGGDSFDLKEIGLARATYVRLIDAGEAYYGHRMWCEGPSGGFDLDAIAAVIR